MFLGADALGVIAAGEVTFTILALFLALSIRVKSAKRLESTRRDSHVVSSGYSHGFVWTATRPHRTVIERPREEMSTGQHRNGDLGRRTRIARMALAVIEGRRRRSVTRWLRGLWSYYRAYTGTAVHTASAAALAIFGLLVFVDPLFAVVAIASYVCPPVVLYVLGVDLRTDSSRPEPTVTETDASDGSSRRTTSGPAPLTSIRNRYRTPMEGTNPSPRIPTPTLPTATRIRIPIPTTATRIPRPTLPTATLIRIPTTATRIPTDGTPIRIPTAKTPKTKIDGVTRGR